MEKITLNDHPLVSVIIPTYKRSDRLPKAIESVLNQTYQNIEIIVVDDNGDTEYRKNTSKILVDLIRDQKIIYIQHKNNQGGCAARNTGIFSATGAFVTFLDDDDFYEPRKVEEQLLFLKENTDLDACMCAMYRIDEKGKNIEAEANFATGTTLKDAILFGNIFTPMLFIKRDVLLELKGFSEIARYQDKFFIYKFLERGFQIGVLKKQLFTLVEHQGGRISLSNPDKVLDALHTLHLFEEKHKNLFSDKEWNFIEHRYVYQRAYNQIYGTISQRFDGVLSLLKSLQYKNRNFKKTAKTFLRLAFLTKKA